MEQLSSSTDPEKLEADKKWFLNYVIMVVSYALIGSLVLNILLLPKSCNENPQTPIMTLEFQIQEWWNSKWNFYVNFCFGFVGYFLFCFSFHLSNPTFKESPVLCTVELVSLMVFLTSVLFEREVIFKDSNESCKNELIEIFQDVQFGGTVCMIIVLLSAFIMCLSRLCKTK